MPMRRFATVALLIIAASAASSCRKKAVVDSADSGAAATASETGYLPETAYDTTSTGHITIAPVNMRATCVAEDVEFALRPWKTSANPATTIRFTLVGRPSAEIYAKDPARWPFTNPSPLTISSGSPTDYAIRGDADTTTYAYGIRFDCGADGGAVDIDPEIIVTQ